MRASIAIAPIYEDEAGPDVLAGYLETLSLVERLHRLMLEVIKDEFERLGQIDLNAVQALLLFNIGSKTLTAGELRSRGYYQGSNVSYNLKKLAEAGFVEHRRCDIDRRTVRIRLTARGMEVHRIVADLFRRHADDLGLAERLPPADLDRMNADLCRLERYWTEEIRYVY
ncbi:winged helix DNA-binding protein [Limibaculum sp. FT325]|uniref:MarR family winged helix-turn-helix transcriptional regulator n=1 Tax=Thermohalobaculum sediminis TaxID=2939436 RepID=UPI0020BD6EFF|nr:winged helix DNA-binding protein [Limibaculum sediminis]MCL5778534.1 winged helix DNA-binding protein [Limibaculum sediminis]